MRLTRAVAWNRWLSALAILGFALVCTSHASAQVVDPTNVRITCTASSTQECNLVSSSTASTTLVTSGTPTLSFTTTSGSTDVGTAYLVVLVPSTTDQNLTFQVNGVTGTDDGVFSTGNLISNSSTAGGFLDIASDGAGATGQFSPLSNVSALATGGIAPTGFNVYVFDLGNFCGAAVTSCPNGYTQAPLSFTVSNGSLPAGTVFWGYVTNSSGQAIDSSPNTELSTIVTPEPATLGLVGCGLLLLGLAVRRQRLV